VRDNIIYQLLPFLALIYPLTLYVRRRSVPTGRDWTVGLSLAGILVAAASIAMREAFGAMAPAGRLVAAYTSLYALPMTIMLLAVYVLRSHSQPRWIGALVLLVTFVAITEPIGTLSARFISLSEAVE
jgi:hypothetical protein